MTSIPLASSFLAGSLLTILMPTLLLVALVVWYVRFLKRVPDSADGSEPESSAKAAADIAPHQHEH